LARIQYLTEAALPFRLKSFFQHFPMRRQQTFERSVRPALREPSKSFDEYSMSLVLIRPNKGCDHELKIARFMDKGGVWNKLLVVFLPMR
jgi:hypothetical protein